MVRWARWSWVGVVAVLALTGSALSGCGAPRDRSLLFGDSAAYTLQDALNWHLGARNFSAAGATYPGCGMIVGVPLIDGSPAPWGQACSEAIPGSQRTAVANADPDLVLWFNYWDTNDRILGSTTVRLGTPQGDPWILALHQQSVDRLTAGGAKVVLLLPAVPAASAKGPPDPTLVTRVDLMRSLLRQLAAANPQRVGVVDLDALVCRNQRPCPPTIDGATPRPGDGLHFSHAGAAWVAPRLAERIAAVWAVLKPA